MDWKLFHTTLAPFYHSYVELASFLALFLLVAVSMAVRRQRQRWRQVIQAVSLFVFFFVVSSCLGVFGLLRNAFQGLAWVGRDDLRAFYWLGIAAVVLALTFQFGAVFCGWICPTGTLQEWMGRLSRRRGGKRPVGRDLVALTLGFGVYLGVIYQVFDRRKPMLEDSAVLWASALVGILYMALLFPDREPGLKRLRVLSLLLLLGFTGAGVAVVSPVHFVFSNVQDPASLLSTLVIMGGSLWVPRSWCRYLCPWGLLCSALGRQALRRITVNEGCTRCGRCTRVCETAAIRDGQLDALACTMCLACVDACPEGALEVTLLGSGVSHV
jgi:polyferredoxin